MWYLKSAFDTYQTVQDTVQNRLTEMQTALLSPVEAMKRFLGGTAPPPPPPAGNSEVSALRKRVAELEATLKKPTRKKRRRRVQN